MTTSPRLVLASLTVAIIAAPACTKQPEPTPPEKALRSRPAAHAGSWYAGDETTLRRDIETRLEAAGAGRPRPNTAGAPIVAMIGPHAGLRFSGDVAAAGYAVLRTQQVKRVFLLGPSHHVPFQGVALPADDLGGYATPLGELTIDQAAVSALRGKPGFSGPARAHDAEHSLEMHAIFIAAVHPTAKLIPLLVGHAGDRQEIAAIADTIRTQLRPGDVVIASSDFTHYGPRYRYLPFTDDVAKNLDDLLTAATRPLLEPSLEGFDAHLSQTHDTVCGREPIRLLLAMLPNGVDATRLAADTSGRQTQDWSNSVTYFASVYRRAGGWPAVSGEHGQRMRQGPQVLDAHGQALALRMARKTLLSYLNGKGTPDDDDLGVPESGPMRESIGAFVTLKKNERLRGCIGHIVPVQPLWRNIRDNAIAAAVKDHRFSPVKAAELAGLKVEISVLTRPVDIDGPGGFEVGRHGVVLHALGRRAVYLPQVAPEQGWDRATTLTHLARKAGLPWNVWQSPQAKLQIFEAQVFQESHVSR